jgi:hypothetical protein
MINDRAISWGTSKGPHCTPKAAVLTRPLHTYLHRLVLTRSRCHQLRKANHCFGILAALLVAPEALSRTLNPTKRWGGVAPASLYPGVCADTLPEYCSIYVMQFELHPHPGIANGHFNGFLCAPRGPRASRWCRRTHGTPCGCVSAPPLYPRHIPAACSLGAGGRSTGGHLLALPCSPAPRCQNPGDIAKTPAHVPRFWPPLMARPPAPLSVAVYLYGVSPPPPPAGTALKRFLNVKFNSPLSLELHWSAPLAPKRVSLESLSIVESLYIRDLQIAKNRCMR